MEGKDLMVGDLVKLSKGNWSEIRHVNLIDIEMISEGVYFAEPIPITTEIIEKNEFVANKHVYPYPYYEYINKEDKLKIGFAFPQGNKTSYKDPWVYIDSERVFIEHLPCMFVHQLQQVLRLCGIDKEIEL